MAWAGWIEGSWKWLDIGPVTLANENATKNTVRSLSNGTVLSIKNHNFVMTVEVVRKFAL